MTGGQVESDETDLYYKRWIKSVVFVYTITMLESFMMSIFWTLFPLTKAVIQVVWDIKQPNQSKIKVETIKLLVANYG